MSNILTNSRARRDYHILDTFEAGIVLKGTEVKSLRAGLGQIRDAYVRVDEGEAWLHNAHIDEYTFGNRVNHYSKAPRKLLLNRREIQKLFTLASIKGHTLVALAFYWKNQRVKLAIGVGKGKVAHDKRQDLKERDAQMEIKRALSHHVKGK